VPPDRDNREVAKNEGHGTATVTATMHARGGHRAAGLSALLVVLTACLACATSPAGATRAGAAAARATASGSATTRAVAVRLYVSKNGRSSGRDGSCATARYRTVSSAVNAAPAGATITVCAGTYDEDVTLHKPLALVGRSATIDASGRANGIEVAASHSSVTGFVVENATGEGILVGHDITGMPTERQLQRPITGVTIAHDTVVDDDRGFAGPAGIDSKCFYGGDCGGGIHLNVVAHSTIADNRVTGNADGILVSDDFGPTYGNLIVGNFVADNRTECGIALASHDAFSDSYDRFYTVLHLNPSLGGVYANTVEDNVVVANGTVPLPPASVPKGTRPLATGGGGGGGVLFGAPFPGAAVYDNVVTGNYIEGNGLAGVTLHAHIPGGEYANGNRVVDNAIATDNIDGDPLDYPSSPVDLQTTGILVYTAVEPVAITISGNTILSDHTGVWLGPRVVDPAVATDNRFAGVTEPVVYGGSLRR
jgi:nitrous oxidase accessory protein NosD